MKKKGNSIGWCDKTANPVWGCPNNCQFDCYARDINNRYKRIPDFNKPQFFPNALKEFRTKEPIIIFIDSMSDIGYWKDEWTLQTYAAMVKNPQNIYLALTKNYKMLHSLQVFVKTMNSHGREAQLLIGASVTNNAQAQAVIDAGGADFISFEPLLEWIKPVLLEQLRCKWWIVGDLTKNGRPQRVARDVEINPIAWYSKFFNIPLFMKDSLKDVMDGTKFGFVQQFPEGWKESANAAEAAAPKE